MYMFEDRYVLCVFKTDYVCPYIHTNIYISVYVSIVCIQNNNIKKSIYLL